MMDCYRTNRSLILERYIEGPVESIYNIPVFPGMRVADIGDGLGEVYDRQSQAFKINLAFGFIMRHVETGRYRYFRAYDNVNLLEEPYLISGRSDIAKVIRKLKAMDIMAETSKARPDTKWRLTLLTNIRIKTYSTNFILGTLDEDDAELPVYVKRNRAIISLDKDPVTKAPYEDELCLFRCLCLYRHGTVDPAKVRELYRRWDAHKNAEDIEELLGGVGTYAGTFKGVQLRELPDFERCFEVNVQMYCLQEDDVTVGVFKSTERYDGTMYVNRYENHCSYIGDFSKYAKKYRCTLCDRMFDHHSHYARHGKTCENKTRYEYPGGFYREQQTIFQQLEEFGIRVPERDRTFPWFAVFDFESILQKVDGDGTEKLQWTHKHLPISVSVCSNVPGYTTPRCFVNADMDELLSRMIGELRSIQSACSTLAESQMGESMRMP